MKHFERQLHLVALSALVLITIAIAWQGITSAPVANDGLVNYSIAHRVADTGSFATKAGLTMTREPFPIFVMAAWIKVFFRDVAAAAPLTANGTEAIAIIKRVNILWAILIVVSAYGAVRLLTQNVWGGLAAAAAMVIAFMYAPSQMDNLNTDLAAGGLIAAAGYFAIRALAGKQWSSAIGLGPVSA